MRSVTRRVLPVLFVFICSAVQAVTIPIIVEVNSNMDDKPFFHPDQMTFADPLNKNPSGYSGTATPGVSTTTTVSGPSIVLVGDARLPDLSDGNRVPYGVTIRLNNVSFTVDAMSGVLAAAGTDGNDGVGINSSGGGNTDANTSQLSGGAGNTVNEQLKFDSLQFTSSTVSDPLGRLQPGTSVGAPFWRVFRSNQFAEATEGAKISSDAAGTLNAVAFGPAPLGVINNNFGPPSATPSTVFQMTSPMYVTTTAGAWGLKGVGYGVNVQVTMAAEPNRRIFSFGNAGSLGEVSRTLTEGGLDITLTPDGESAGLGYNNSGVGVISFGDPDGVGTTDADKRIEGATGANSGSGLRNLPESLRFSFSQDVVLESMLIGNLSGGGLEPLNLSFVSGDNPFTGLTGYSSDGFSTDGNSVTYTRTDGNGEASIVFGTDTNGRDPILVTAGTVLGLTTNPSVSGGALLRMLSANLVPDGIFGDFNDDDTVDAADYVIWRRNENDPTNALPNDNGLGTPIGPGHYALWRQNFGESLPGSGLGSAAQVPEPNCAFTLLIAALAFVDRRRRRHDGRLQAMRARLPDELMGLCTANIDSMCNRFGVRTTVLVLLTGALQLCLAIEAGYCQSPAPRPNIVHIFADDLGKLALGVYGQNARAAQGLPAIQTPSLDAIAVSGMTFSRAYSATLCSPSRGMLMTGFHQGHGHNDRNTQAFRSADITVAQRLQAANYTTGVFGKWGYGGSVGENPNGVSKEFDLSHSPTITNTATLPNAKGYDEFFGELNHSRAHLYFASSLWTTDATGNPQTAGVSEYFLGNQDPADPNHNLQQTYTHDVVAERSEQFIQAHYQDADPFYMQVNYTIPHNDLEAIQYVPGWFDSYSNVNTTGWTTKEKSYAAMITRMDASIGSLVDRLGDPNGDGNQADSVLANTIIMFTADNGATDADFDSAGLEHFGLNATQRGGKRDLWEGGINLPLLVRWDGHIAPNSTSNYLTDLADFMPTAAKLAGVTTPVGIDGVSIVPTLLGTGTQRNRNYLILEHHEGDGPDPDTRHAAWAIIRGNQKLIRFENGDNELYDLSTDPLESNPLNLALPQNNALRAELESIAIAEGVNRPDSYANQFQTWTGSSGNELTNPALWTGSTTGAPSDNWSAVVQNSTTSPSVVKTGGTVSTLGFEVRGTQAAQTVRVGQGDILTGRNEVRIGDRGRVQLDGGTLSSNRWIDVEPLGALTGVGDVQGSVFNRGNVAPGRPADLPADSGGGGNVDTGVVSALVFNFSGIQDAAPLTQTSVLNQNLQLVAGLDFGPGLAPRNAANAGSEFNVMGFLNQAQVPSSLAAAIVAGDYLTFTVAPVAGVAMDLENVSVNLWRNGSGAAEQYAILTSLDGFTAGQEIGTLSAFDSGSNNQHLLVGSAPDETNSSEPVEIRVYGWNANGTNGNTHFNAVSLTASFVSVPTTPLSPQGELLLHGNYTQLPTGALAIDLGGTDKTDPATSQYDSLRIAGVAQLNGKLSVSLADVGGSLFAPGLDNEFEIVRADQLMGQFNTTELPPLPFDLEWDIVYTDQTVTLQVEVNQTGDYDRNHKVDASDYLIWRLNNGSPAAYEIWRTHFGETIATGTNVQGSVTVPEPTSSVLLVMGLAIAGHARRRSSRIALN